LHTRSRSYKHLSPEATELLEQERTRQAEVEAAADANAEHESEPGRDNPQSTNSVSDDEQTNATGYETGSTSFM